MNALVIGWMTAYGLFPEIVWAKQAHVDPEGIYAHQLAHLFFMMSMVLFIYWLRRRKLTTKIGWRYIQYGAFFLILWNAIVIAVHFLDEQGQWITVEPVNIWRFRILSSLGDGVKKTYYLARLDHLICVPALLFLYKGLKKLADETESSSEADN